MTVRRHNVAFFLLVSFFLQTLSLHIQIMYSYSASHVPTSLLWSSQKRYTSVWTVQLCFSRRFKSVQAYAVWVCQSTERLTVHLRQRCSCLGRGCLTPGAYRSPFAHCDCREGQRERQEEKRQKKRREFSHWNSTTVKTRGMDRELKRVRHTTLVFAEKFPTSAW